MKLGLVFPSQEIELDAAAPSTFVEGAQTLGFDHILALDHVVGAEIDGRPDWRGPYTHAHAFREPLILFAHLAAACSLDFATYVLVLPQRQTALVAKQAADLDLLCSGRLRLGVGLGWNEVEYDALGSAFARRGARLEQQIHLLRRLWTEPVVDLGVVGSERVERAGINPLPVQRPIPVWLGGGAASERAIGRVARRADGWMPSTMKNAQSSWEAIRVYAARAGRNPEAIGLQGVVSVADRGPLQRRTRAWLGMDATHLALMTNGAGPTAEHHLSVAARMLDYMAPLLP